MMREELYAVTKKAVEENEMAELLQGKGIYQCPSDRFLPACSSKVPNQRWSTVLA